MSSKGGGVTLPGFMDQLQKVDEEVNGVIVENEDTKEKYPESGKMLGRVKVHVKGYNDKIPVKDLPWVTQLVPVNTGTGKGVSLTVPALGTKVKVKKVGNDDYTWQAINQVMTTKHSELGWLQKDYPNTWGAKDKTGSGYRLNMKDKSAYFLHTSKTDAHIDAAGATKVNIRDWLNVYIEAYNKWQIDEYSSTKINLHELRDVGQYFKTKIGTYFDSTIGTYFRNVIGTFRDTAVGTNDTLSVGGYQSTAVTGLRSCTVGANDTLIVNGQITITSTGGSINITAASSVVVNAPTCTMNTPITTINGNVIVNGTVTATGEVTSGIIGLQRHKHAGVKPGPSITTPSIP